MSASARLPQSDRALSGETHSLRKIARIDLGLAVSAASLRPGESRSIYELAAFCACTPQAISKMTLNAIAKVRKALRKRYGITSTNR